MRRLLVLLCVLVVVLAAAATAYAWHGIAGIDLPSDAATTSTTAD